MDVQNSTLDLLQNAETMIWINGEIYHVHGMRNSVFLKILILKLISKSQLLGDFP